MEKLTSFEVSQYLQKNGYVWVSGEYINLDSYLIIKDKNEYKYRCTLSNLKNKRNPRFVGNGNPYSIHNISLWCKLNNKQFDIVSVEFKNAKSKLSWMCQKCGETFLMTWAGVQTGYNCTICIGKIVSTSNCLFNKNQTLASEWNYERNNGLTPHEVTQFSTKIVWWVCKNGHEWKISVQNRSNGSGCPYCGKHYASKEKNLLLMYPDICSEWDYEVNDMCPENYLPKSHRIVGWVCNEGHKWNASIANRTSNDQGCPYCSKRYATEEYNLKIIFPEVCEEWDYEKNKKSPCSYSPKSSQSVFWKCKYGHSFKSKIGNRTILQQGCPICGGSKGEKRISLWLSKKHISHFPQKSFNGLYGLGGGCLSYDFYVPEYNLLIEYQGEFHDGSGKGEFTKINLHKQIMHDEIKRNYARENNINLLEIWHWDYNNIEDILQNEFERIGNG